MIRFTINVICVMGLMTLGVLVKHDRDMFLAAQQEALDASEKDIEYRRQIDAMVAKADADKKAGKIHKVAFPERPETALPGHVTFTQLAKMPREILKHDVEIPEEIRALDGQRVSITGFVLITFPVEPITEITIAKNPWDECCIGTPPTALDSVLVKLRPDRALKKSRIRVGTMTGTFRVKLVRDGPWILTLYTLEDAEETESAVPEVAVESHQMVYFTLMPLLLVAAAVTNLIPARRRPVENYADVQFSNKKFSIED